MKLTRRQFLRGAGAVAGLALLPSLPIAETLPIPGAMVGPYITTQGVADSIINNAEFWEGCRRGSAMILDNLGITVNVHEAFTSYGEMLGKSKWDLTDYERQAAIIGAVV